MLIDWFTVMAQIVNFLILVWLLKRFLYVPVLKAIDQREEKIKNQIRDAENKMAEAEKEKDTYHLKNQTFEQQREYLLSEAAGEAESVRQKLLESTRREAKELRNRLKESIRTEQMDLNREIVARTQEEVFALARKVLADLASESLEEHIAGVFIRKLNGLKGEKKALLVTALKASPGDVVLRSAFDLSRELRMAIEKTLEKITMVNILPRFESAPKLIGGIELTTAGGYKIAWSIEDYLNALEKRVAALLNEHQEHASEPIVKPAPNESNT